VKQNLKQWVGALSNDGLLEQALVYLEKNQVISGSARFHARRESDFGRGMLHSKALEMIGTEDGRKRLGKLKNSVRQWRASKKQKGLNRVTRKITLSPEANRILEDLTGPSGTGFTHSGLIDYLLKRESPIFNEQRSLIDRDRAKLKAENKKSADSLNQRKNILDDREEKINDWQELRSLGEKALLHTGKLPDQDILISIERRNNANHCIEVDVSSGSKKLQQSVIDSTTNLVENIFGLMKK
jgi:hypothetical protein